MRAVVVTELGCSVAPFRRSFLRAWAFLWAAAALFFLLPFGPGLWIIRVGLSVVYAAIAYLLEGEARSDIRIDNSGIVVRNGWHKVSIEWRLLDRFVLEDSRFGRRWRRVAHLLGTDGARIRCRVLQPPGWGEDDVVRAVDELNDIVSRHRQIGLWRDRPED
jgi:hypothetical protein